MGRRQQYVYHTLPEVFPPDFPDRLDCFRQAAGFTWGGLARALRVNARTVRRWKAGAGVGSGHLINLLELAAAMGLLHHLLRGVASPEVPLESADQYVLHNSSFNAETESIAQMLGEDVPEPRPSLLPPLPARGGNHGLGR